METRTNVADGNKRDNRISSTLSSETFVARMMIELS